MRAVLVEITATIKDREIHLLVHWKGGDHTELVVPRRRPGQHRWTTDAETVALVRDLARMLPDELIAGLLNRLGRKTSKGNSWTKSRVRSFRSARDIAVYREGERGERGELILSGSGRAAWRAFFRHSSADPFGSASCSPSLQGSALDHQGRGHRQRRGSGRAIENQPVNSRPETEKH